jgi:hypothetical protein
MVAPSLCSCTFLLNAILDPTTKTHQGKSKCGRIGVAILGSLSQQQQPIEIWGKRANNLQVKAFFSGWGWPKKISGRSRNDEGTEGRPSLIPRMWLPISTHL